MTFSQQLVNDLALKHGLTFSLVKKIISTQAITIRDTIKKDNPDVSVKIDYWGTFESLPYRRKMIEDKVKAKKLLEETNGLTDTER